ncbi:YggS family pyridoxal phosphate-dependent enzyme [bacterium]|nr:YggS family pyridoxal phosphate-dependent enzyme [bacterium]
MLLEQIDLVENRIQSACKRSGRSRNEVQLLLASKKVSASRLKELAALPQVLLGENTAQELVAKRRELSKFDFKWHFIGHLQTNKVKDVLDCCELIHSVDRISLASEISKRSLQKNRTTSILIEVNTSGEKSKSGVLPEELLVLCRQISQLSNIAVCGLMTVPENSANESTVRQNFQLLKKLFTDVEREKFVNFRLKELSMGMSHDFEWAIEEGATIVRIGSLIFGERPRT